MATYPRFGTVDDSTCNVQGGQQPARATNGALKVRNLWAASKREFGLHHVLTATERATLETFYGANKDLDVSYVSPWDGATYTVRFTGAPTYIRRGQYHDTRVTLAEV